MTNLINDIIESYQYNVSEYIWELMSKYDNLFEFDDSPEFLTDVDHDTVFIDYDCQLPNAEIITENYTLIMTHYNDNYYDVNVKFEIYFEDDKENIYGSNIADVNTGDKQVDAAIKSYIESFKDACDEYYVYLDDVASEIQAEIEDSVSE